MKLKRFLTLGVFALCFACVAGLAGCGNAAMSGSSSTDPAAANRAYMSSANTVVESLQADLGDFSNAVAEDDLVNMKAAAKKAAKDIEDFQNLKPTDALADVHKEYSAGCNNLKAALDDYVDLYTDRKKGNLSNADYKSRVKAIQKEYDKGIDHLKAGDKKATSL